MAKRPSQSATMKPPSGTTATLSVNFPNYYRALASLGRVRAARGDMSGAIEQYECVTRALPDPVFVAALGDLYHLTGREKNAAASPVRACRADRKARRNKGAALAIASLRCFMPTTTLRFR